MKVRKVIEVSCYMENQPGVLGRVAGALAKEGINIVGIHSYEGHLQNMTRFVVADEHVFKTEMILRGMGIELVTQTEVIEITFQSKVGFVAALSTYLGKKGVNIVIAYFTESPHAETIAFLTVDRTDETLEILEAAVKLEEFSEY